MVSNGEVSNGEVRVNKVPTDDNWSDLATKPHDHKRMMQCLLSCDFVMVSGQSKLVLQAAT